MRASRFAVHAICLALASAAPAGAQPDGDVERAFAAARAKAGAGDVIAQFSLGQMLYYGGEDTAQAIDWIRKAAAQRHPDAEFHLGQIYDFGFGEGGPIRKDTLWFYGALRTWGAVEELGGVFRNANQAALLPANISTAASIRFVPDTSRPAEYDRHTKDGSLRFTWQL